MKIKNNLIFLLLFAAQISFSQRIESDNLKQLSQQHQFVKMDSVNNHIKNKDYYFYKAVFANVCNKPLLSNLYLDSLKNSTIINDLEYIKLRNDNYVKLFNYEMAFQTSVVLTTKYSKKISKEEYDDEINAQRIWEVLRTKPAQTIEPFTIVRLPAKKDKAGLITTIVNAKDMDTSFVFDTGAGISCITETMAKKFGLIILPDNNISISSFTGQKKRVKIGVAQLLAIGNIKLHNAVFLVYPDGSFTFGNGAYVINGIIGFPIAKELGTITIEKENLFFSKINNGDVKEKNLFIDQLRALVMLTFRGKKLPYNFDSGADESLFNKSFYKTFKTYIDKIGELSTTKTSGAGAKQITSEIVELKNQAISLGTDVIKLHRMKIRKNEYGVYGKVNFGNIGQDIIGKFKKVTISFDHNYLLLEN